MVGRNWVHALSFLFYPDRLLRRICDARDRAPAAVWRDPMRPVARRFRLAFSLPGDRWMTTPLAGVMRRRRPGGCWFGEQQRLRKAGAFQIAEVHAFVGAMCGGGRHRGGVPAGAGEAGAPPRPRHGAHVRLPRPAQVRCLPQACAQHAQGINDVVIHKPLTQAARSSTGLSAAGLAGVLAEISSVQVKRHIGTHGRCRRGGRVGSVTSRQDHQPAEHPDHDQVGEGV